MTLSFERLFRISKQIGNSNWIINSKKTWFNVNPPTSLNLIRRHIHANYNLAAKVAFNLSDIGEGIREVVVKEWYVKVGDNVNQFDKVCEVQSDKASVTITSRYDGTISKLYYGVDDVALVGNPLVDIETEQTDDVVELEESKPIISENVAVQNEEATKIVKEPVVNDYLVESEDISRSSSPSVEETPVLCIPSVRRLAHEHKVNLSSIKGTGKNGRILKEDILSHITKKPEIKSTIPETGNIQPIKGFQKVMVKTMTESSKIPVFVYSDEIKVTELSKLRKYLKSVPELKDIKLSFMPFFIKAASNALQHYPILNASVDENCENVIYHERHNIGIAMDTNVGLAVPVIKGVENLSIMEITKELNRLLECGRNGSFLPSDMVDGTFAISNIGAIGGTYTKPLILPPQVAIIALGASRILPRYDDNKNIVPEETVNISGSADHRIIDGATMARFIQVLKKQVQNPYLLFLNL